MYISLREWKKSDLLGLVKFANNFNVAKNLTDHFPHPYTTEAGESFIEKSSSHTGAFIFAIDLNGVAIVAIGIHPQDDIEKYNAELGYWLAEPFWGMGIMTLAIKEIVEIGFDELEINRIFARPFGTNIGSQRALEKAGFTLEAKFEKTFFKNGEYLDELIYAVRKN